MAGNSKRQSKSQPTWTDVKAKGLPKTHKFSSENSRLLHQLARKSGLNLPKVPGCSDCAEPEVMGVQQVLQDMWVVHVF